MLKAIFTLFIAFVVIILGVFLAIGARIYRSYHSIKKTWSKNQQGSSQSHNNQQSGNSAKSNNSQTRDNSKIIGDDEGEYVEFEEEIDSSQDSK